MTVLLLLGILLLAHSRNIRYTAPSPQDMDAKRKEWETNYIATQGPPTPMHEVEGGPCTAGQTIKFALLEP